MRGRWRWMRRVAPALGAAALLAACGGGEDDAAVPPALAVPPFGLSGQVVTESGAPVAGAEVELFTTGSGSPLTETTSGSDGGFAFLVMDGDYRIEASAAGYRISPSGEEATVDGRDLALPAFVATPSP